MIFVDNMMTSATVYNPWTGRNVTGAFSHLTADTDEELHEFAARLGLKREYHQPSPPASRSHYDVTKGVRNRAIALGAIAVRIGCEPWRGLGKRRTREGYEPGGACYAPDAQATLPAGYQFPEPSLRERRLELLEAGTPFVNGEPEPI